MAPTPASDSPNVCWISGAAADSATATRLAAEIAASESASPRTVRRRADAVAGGAWRARVRAGPGRLLRHGGQAGGTCRPCPGAATIDPLSKTRCPRT